MSESWTIKKGDKSKEFFIRNLEVLINKHGAVTYSAPRLGTSRLITQNNLFHVFIKEYARHMFRKNDVGVGEIDGMKRIIKMGFYNAYPSCDWMIYELINPITQERKNEYTSSSSYKTGEMYMMLEFIQNNAAKDGLILESKGRFLKLQQKSDGV